MTLADHCFCLFRIPHAQRRGDVFQRVPRDQKEYGLTLPQREIERLTLVHEALMSLLDNRLFIAPIDGDNLGRVLDMGTGTGTCMFNRF